jgi:hypothetical protein
MTVEVAHYRVQKPPLISSDSATAGSALDIRSDLPCRISSSRHVFWPK